MSNLSASQKETLELFTSGVEKLEKAVAGLSEKELDYSLAPGEWSIRQIVHHVTDDGDGWSFVLKKALGTPGVGFSFGDPGDFPGNEAWANALAFQKRPVTTSLALIISHRKFFNELATYFAGSWENYVTYLDDKGKKNKFTAGQIIRMLAEHLMEHVATIESIKKKHGMGKPTTKARLLKDIRAERQKLEIALQGLTDADMVKTTVAGEWSVKDILAHVTTWEQSFLKWYEAGLRGEKQVMPEWSKPGVIDAINKEIYERNAKRSLNDVKKEFHASYKTILKTIDQIPEEAMFITGKYDWTGKYTLADYTVVNTGGHYTEHLAMIEAIKKKHGT